MSKINRRNFMQRGSAMALAAAYATALPTGAMAARENELNIFCWEGYNSDSVLDPFRREFDATVRTEALTGDPDAVNRLRAGESKIWDLININHPWARNILYPENLIKPIARERFEPYYEKMMSAFAPPYHWAMDDSGEHLLGMIQRLGTFSFAVNTDKISREMSEDQGWDLFLDPAMEGTYGMLTYDDWNIAHIMLTAGIDPYREHTAEEVEKYTEVAKRIIGGTKMFSDDLTQINLAMINGEIDACFSGGTYSVSSARYDGATNIRGITPLRGPLEGNKGGLNWIELTSVLNRPDSSPLAEEFLAYVQRPEVSKEVAFAEGTYNPVANMSDPDVLARFDSDELDAIQWDTLEEDLARGAEYNIIPDLPVLHEIYSNLRRERQN